MQDWIGGDFNWSEPIIRDAGLVVANIDAPVVHSLLDLQNQRIGTILGYVYPELEHAGVTHYERDDAPSMSLNIRKVAEGRMKYALIEALALYYQIRAQPDQRIRTDFVYGTFTASCAFSRQSQVPFAEIDNAIKQLIADGALCANDSCDNLGL